VIFGARHPRDERLYDCYLAARHGEAMDLTTAEHLVTCGRCGSRYAELSAFFEAMGREGEDEADAVFTAERLTAQQRQIASRLSRVARPARVISFPESSARVAVGSRVSRAAPRWMAAAAAGLFVGVALTASFEWGSQVRSARHASAIDAPAPRLGVGPTDGLAEVDLPADDAFLTELEVALESPHTRELVAFDALTPHVLLEISAK
jgi:hypothetical protein